jgi:hypothetical protein
MSPFGGPLLQEAILHKPLHEFNRDELFHVLKNEFVNTRPFPRQTELSRVTLELAVRFDIILPSHEEMQAIGWE